MGEPLLLPLILLAWGTIVGLDLVTFPQVMISRPLVAGSVAGLLTGAVLPGVAVAAALPTGLAVGAALELYALDVLPVGASRYPDYGPGTVAAVYAALDWDLHQGLGVGVLVGLLMAVVGGAALQVLRRANARAIQRRAAALSAGEAGAIRALQLGGIRRDVARSALVTLIGLVVAKVIWPLLPPGRENFGWLTTVAVGGGLAAALGGAIRSAGRTRRLAWVTCGVAGGVLLMTLR